MFEGAAIPHTPRSAVSATHAAASPNIRREGRSLLPPPAQDLSSCSHAAEIKEKAKKQAGNSGSGQQGGGASGRVGDVVKERREHRHVQGKGDRHTGPAAEFLQQDVHCKASLYVPFRIPDVLLFIYSW